MTLILASSSPYRKKLLTRLGTPFECVPPHIDENQLKSSGLPVEDLVCQLSLLKGKAVQKSYPQAIIISSDQIGICQGQILNKPHDFSNAKKMLQFMQGKVHHLLTSFHVLTENKLYHHTDTTTLKMRALSEQEIERYLKIDEPFDCAGGYKLEKLGISLFESLNTHDPTAIEGLPLMALSDILRKLSIPLP